MENSLRPVIVIAKNTYRESSRSRLIYVTVISALALVCVAMCFGLVTIGDPIKMAKDFGLFSISISVMSFVVISGSSHLHKELAKKTIHNILSKAVERWQFVLGKFFGMLSTATAMIISMGTFLSLSLWLIEGRFDWLLPVSYLYVFLETIIICGFATLFASSVVTPALSGILTFGIFLAGRSLEYLMYFVQNGSAAGISKSLLITLYWLLPNLSNLSISDQVVYGIPVSFEHISLSVAYSLSYAIVLVTLACIFFQRREFL